MVQRVCSPKGYDQLALEDNKLCLQNLCQGDEARWLNYQNLLATPAGRKQLLGYDPPGQSGPTGPPRPLPLISVKLVSLA
jgi:hypothetical protein